MSFTNQNLLSSPLLSEPAAAVYLHCSLSKLRRMRRKGIGPVFTKIGRNIYYRVSELDAFLDRNSSDFNGRA